MAGAKGRILSERLIQTPIGPRHAQCVMTHLTPDLMAYYGPGPADSLPAMRAQLERDRLDMAAGHLLKYAVALKDGGAFIGCSAMSFIWPDRPQPDLWIARSAQGKGFGREALCALIAHTQAHYAHDFILCRIDARNTASRRMVEAAGGVLMREYEAARPDGSALLIVEMNIYPKAQVHI